MTLIIKWPYDYAFLYYALGIHSALLLEAARHTHLTPCARFEQRVAPLTRKFRKRVHCCVSINFPYDNAVPFSLRRFRNQSLGVYNLSFFTRLVDGRAWHCAAVMWPSTHAVIKLVTCELRMFTILIWAHYSRQILGPRWRSFVMSIRILASHVFHPICWWFWTRQFDCSVATLELR